MTLKHIIFLIITVSVFVNCVWADQQKNSHIQYDAIECQGTDSASNLGALTDGKNTTEFSVSGKNLHFSITIDLKEARLVKSIVITNGHSEPVPFLKSLKIGGYKNNLREVLARWINLPCWRGGDQSVIDIEPVVARFVKLSFHSQVFLICSWLLADQISLQS